MTVNELIIALTRMSRLHETGIGLKEVCIPYPNDNGYMQDTPITKIEDQPKHNYVVLEVG